MANAIALEWWSILILRDALQGLGDLLNAMFQGVRRIDMKGPSQLGAAFFIPTVIVPALLITHGLMFWLLLRGPH